MTGAPSQGPSRLARLKWWLSPWRVMMLLAYGAFMTFVTAWGCALLGPAPALVAWRPGNLQTGQLAWGMTNDGFGRSRYVVRRSTGSGPSTVSPPSQAVAPGELEFVSPKVNAESWVGGVTTIDEVRTYVYGFPFPSMRWWSDFPPATGMSPGILWTPDQPIDRHAGLLIAEGTRTSDAKMLPLSVCVRPFVMNVVFWMVTMVVGVEVNAVVRRWRHGRAERKRGACPYCGYDRKGLGAGVVCPECGKGAGTK